MQIAIIRDSLHKLSETVSFNYPAIGWYYAAERIEPSFAFKSNRWVCMFMHLKMVLNKGRRIRFSKDHGNACVGTAEYFGFKKLTGKDGRFIADKERFKKSRKLARNYYQESLKRIPSPKAEYLYLEKIDTIEQDREIEVINLFPDVTGLASLTVLSNYDREQNMDNVLTPFASGCQSVFTIPYHEKFQQSPKSVIGLMDPLVRQFIPENMLAFSVPANRFVEMAENVESSFLDRKLKDAADLGAAPD